MSKPGSETIIKKVKKGGHGGHHGGAWKVAYADFVTAMMAFFLLLWLLATTSPEQKVGIAEYFTPTYGLKDAKGVGIKGGNSPNVEGESKSTLTDPGIVVGRVPQGPDAADPSKVEDETPKDVDTGAVAPTTPKENPELEKQDDSGDKGSADADAEEFKRVEQEMMNAFEQSPELKELKNNIIITHTPEGLKIDIVDEQNRPMFAAGSALVTDSGKKVMEAISRVVATTTNKISMAGHTDASPFSAGNNYSNWELSADRANASRRVVTSAGVGPERIAKVQGLAGEDLLLPNEPNSPRNRRISLTLMRGVYTDRNTQLKPTSKGLLSVPDVEKVEPQTKAPAAPEEPDSILPPPGAQP